MTESITLTALSWLATYLVHSTLLIGCVWAFTGACSLDSLTRSLLWKLALVGGLFTATLQTGLGVQPALGLSSLTGPATEAAPVPVPVPERLSVESRVLLISGSEVIRVDEQGVCIGPGCELPAWRSPGLMLADLDAEELPSELLLIDDSPRELPVAPEAPAGDDLAGWLIGLFAFGAGASLVRLGFLVRGLRRSLRGRTPIEAGPLHERLVSLVARARVRRMPTRLTVSAGLCSPVALASGEIVVPPEALDLEARQQEAMLAHELAHVLRRDPAWLVLAAVIEAVLFIQPLNRVARRGMQEAAEELSDDWAVRHIGGGLHLARCLTEVASWLDRDDRAIKPCRLASPMASGSGSLLVRRVRRLLAQQPGARRLAGAWRVLMALGLLLAVGLGAPGFAPPLAQASAPPAAPELADPSAAPSVPSLRERPFVAAGGDAMPELTALPAGGSCDSRAEAPSSARERRLAKRAARLERRAEQLRRRSGTAPRFVVIPAEAAGAPTMHIDGPDEAELRRIIVDAQRSIPGEAELRRIADDARRVEAEVRRIVVPREATMRTLEADARRLADRAAKLDTREVRELAREMARAGRELAREAEQIEREVRRELEREGLVQHDGSPAPLPPRPPRAPRAGTAPMAPPAPHGPDMAPMPPTAPPAPPGSGMAPMAPMPPMAPPAPPASHGPGMAPTPPAAPPSPPAPPAPRTVKRAPV